MKRMFVWGCLLAACVVRAQTEALPAEVTQMRGALYTELGKLAEEYNAALLPIAEGYVLDLRRLAARMVEAKDAKGQDAVRKEATRFMKALEAEPDPFETVPELPNDVLHASVEALRLVQQGYIAKRTVADRLRNEKAVELGEKYTEALEKQAANREARTYRTAEMLADAQKLAEAEKKETRRVRVVLQRKDAASVLFKEAKAVFKLMPPVPDVANLKERAEAPPEAGGKEGMLTLNRLPPDVQIRLSKPVPYDKDWPPEVTKWKYEGTGNFSHDYSLYRTAGLPGELGIFVYDKTMRAYVAGTKRAETVNVGGNAVTWMGKGMSWLLTDSRDLVCKVMFTTKTSAVSQSAGPAGCVAVYSTSESNKLIGSMTVPLLTEVTEVRVLKHFSYNRLNISWQKDGKVARRGFTIPDHMPLRVVIGVNCYHPGEVADTLIEIETCTQVGDAW